MMILHIAWRELRNLFLSPLAWCLLAIVQGVHAWLFLFAVQRFMENPATVAGVTDTVAAGLFNIAGFLTLPIVSLLSMRLLAEERHNGSLTLLLSAPVRLTELVLGKYLGLMGFLAVMALMLALMPLSLALGTHLDYRKLATELSGFLLLLGAFAAAGLFMSGFTRHPLIAAFSSFGLLLFLWIVNVFAGLVKSASPLFHYLSLQDHFQSWLTGSFNSADAVFYVLFIATFLVLCIRRLDTARLGG
ncbi:MAG: ABC transporter permease [Bacillota bacterium]